MHWAHDGADAPSSLKQRDNVVSPPRIAVGHQACLSRVRVVPFRGPRLVRWLPHALYLAIYASMHTGTGGQLLKRSAQWMAAGNGPKSC